MSEERKSYPDFNICFCRCLMYVEWHDDNESKKNAFKNLNPD